MAKSHTESGPGAITSRRALLVKKPRLDWGNGFNNLKVAIVRDGAGKLLNPRAFKKPRNN